MASPNDGITLFVFEGASGMERVFYRASGADEQNQVSE